MRILRNFKIGKNSPVFTNFNNGLQKFAKIRDFALFQFQV